MSSPFPWLDIVSSRSTTSMLFFLVEVYILIFSMLCSFVAVFKGTTKFREEDGSPLMFTGPVPTTHVHIYNLDTEAWTTTYMDQAGETLKMASIFRIKTRLAFNNVKPKAKDWYLVFD